MTPHAVLEGMARAVRDHGGIDALRDHVDVQVWPDVVKALSQAVHFELGEARPTEPHEEFAFELFERDMFRMPFPCTFWTGRASPNTAVLVSEADPETWRPVGEHAGGVRGLGLIIIGQMLDRKGSGRREWYVPLVSGRMSHTPLAHDGGVKFGWRGLTQTAASRKSGRPWDTEDFAAAIDKCWRLACGATAMLMTPDVDQRIEPAPVKLNKARSAKGKPLIGERRVVIIKPHAIGALSGAEARAAFEGRSAPRPHMRRGHFRTIHRGAENQRVVPVAPCVVGISDDAREAVRPKQYVIKGAEHV